MKKPNSPSTIQVKVLTPEEMLLARWKSSSYARRNLTAQQVHRQMKRNGSVLSPNPFYNGAKTPEDSFRLLNSVS